MLYNIHIFILYMVYTNNNNSKYILYTWYRPYTLYIPFTWYTLYTRYILSIIFKSNVCYFKKMGIEKNLTFFLVIVKVRASPVQQFSSKKVRAIF